MHGICKVFTTKIGLKLLRRLSQNVGYFSYHQTQDKSVCHKRWNSRESVSCEKVSGRTVQLDEIGESSSLGQSSATPEVVLEFPIMTEMKATTCVVETSVKLAAEPRRLSRLCIKPSAV